MKINTEKTEPEPVITGKAKTVTTGNLKLPDNMETSGHLQAPFYILVLATLGVVYGDIGTSPLYAIKECFHGTHGIELSKANILGVLSLVFWSLTMVVSVKYISFVMMADNHGEGGIFALLALIPTDKRISKQTRTFVVIAALLGASLLYGDGVITPAISVLSAIEGLEVATAAAKPFTVPLTCLVLFALFLFQYKGTGSVGKVFGFVMVFWFSTIAVLGFAQIFQNPHVLYSINPYYAIDFFFRNHITGFVVLGAVVLCITGGEALYADMGHFGRRPIQVSWFAFVFPALLINYLGQGALLLNHPETVENPFFGMVPKVLIVPMVILATTATIIASQALISGAFSLTKQAIQLGFFPRLNIIHTSEHTEGQIYLPFVNKALMLGCIATVLIFRESTNLASAYGIAVTANMVLTSIVFYIVTTKTWNWPTRKALPLIIFFLAFDITYFLSNIIKVLDGGWFPLGMASVILILMFTWRDGRAELARRIREKRLPVYLMPDGTATLKSIPGTSHLIEPGQTINSSFLPIELLTGELANSLERIPGTAVFMTVSLKSIPPVMLHYLRHIKILHEEVILLSIKSKDIPYVTNPEEFIEINEVGFGFFQVVAQYGFMQIPNVPEILKRVKEMGLNIDIDDITYFLGREALVLTRKSKMMRWKKGLFAFLSRNAQSATNFFNIPPDNVVELGMQIEL
jgi:KUP system potassium uptake protein